MRHLVLLVALPLLAVVDQPYQEALPGYRYSFPRDHFEHPAFRTEWWYYTGNVWDATGRRFGFELVFFRQGVRAGDRGNPSAWRIDDVYLAHAALTDVEGKRFTYRERLNRAGPGIAGASFSRQRIWNGNWSVDWKGSAQKLTATAGDFSFSLDCQPEKPLVIHGENGISRKAAGPGRASHYISFPRLRVQGSIRSGTRTFQVSGQAWMDHEWFSNQLEKNQAGWDWFSIQLENRTELMLFDLRRKDGGVDPYTSGTYIASDGQARHLTNADFSLKPLEWWRSPKTGTRYPIAWTIEVPSLKLRLQCRATLPNQELADTHGAKYWEGTVDYSGSSRGVGYLEMTGYDKPVEMQ